MVYKHNQLPCDHENTLHAMLQHTRQLDCGDQFGHRHIPEKRQFPDVSRIGGNLEPVKTDVVASNHISSTLDGTSNCSLVLSSNGDATRLENNIKRPFGDAENFQVAAKRTRQLDWNFPTAHSSREGSFTASDDQFNDTKCRATHRSANDSSGCIFSFRWFRCEDPPLESFYPGCYEDRWRPARHVQRDECQSPVFDSVPRKSVAIGPDHQADIPMCRSKSFQGCHQGDGFDASASCGNIQTDEDSWKKWTQHCVMPMRDSKTLEEGPFRSFESDCHCLDEGSIRCVRQHVMEARGKLRSSLGHERFVELGFCDMGEDVGLGWTEEEERLFNDVVLYNPASLGRNFWDGLALAFPSRSSKELVSYYFNVFMLRKRAEQNRVDSSNVDSDNDEWQYSDDDGEFEATEEEEEEDSGVESPADAAVEDAGAHIDGASDIHVEADKEHGICEGFPGDGNSKFGHSDEDQGVQDDSCTSFEGVGHGELHPDYRSACLTTDNEFIIGDCDPKPWEMMSYFRGSDKKLEFLPTCNVIEEVFGNESWEKSREDHGVS